MDIGKLRSIVKVVAGRLDVSIDDFASATLAASIKPFLADGKLSLASVPAPTDDGKSIVVSGVGGARPFLNTQVAVTFALLDNPQDPADNVAISIRADAQVGWKPSDMFAALLGSAANAIAFKQPTTIYLSSRANAFPGIDAGMFFDGEVDMEAVFNVWSFLLGTDGSVTGVIQMVEGVPSFVLAGAQFAQGNLGFLKLSDLSWEIYCDPRYDAHELEWTVDTYTGFSAALPLDTPGGDVKSRVLKIRAFIYDPKKSILFTVDFDDAVDAALEELSSLVKGTALSVPFDGLDIANRVKFQDLKVSVNPSSSQIVEYVSLGVATGIDWEIVDAFLTLQEIDVSFRVDFPAQGSPQVSGSVSGLIGIGDSGTLELTAHFGVFAFGGGLREEDPPLKIREAFADFLDLEDDAAAQLELPDLAVTTFDFYIEPSSKRYSGDIELAGSWALPFVNNVTLEDIAFNLDHPDAETGVLFKARALFLIDTVHLAISADYAGGVGGWTFSGSTGPGEAIALGAFLSNLARRIGIDGTPPKPIEDLTLSDLSLTVNTARKDFAFSGKASFPIDGKEVGLALAVALTHTGVTDYARQVGGELTVAGLAFGVAFHQDPKKTLLVASYREIATKPINVGDLLAEVTTDQNIIDLGANLSIDLKNALFGYEKGDGTLANPSRFLFGLEMGFGIDLSNLPLVGKLFPADAALRLNFLPIVASQPFLQADVAALRALVPEGGTPLPDKDLPKGITLSITLRIGDTPIDLSLPIKVDTATGKLADNAGGAQVPGQGGSTAPSGAPAPADGVKWFDIQKSLGPVHFARIGVKYKDARLYFLLDASLAAAGLTLSLYGLSASSPLTSFDPKFNLDGLGIDYSNAAVEIGGAFLHVPPQLPERPYDEYDGAAIVKASEWSLSAIGSYAYVDGHPSMFIYAVLDAPLGGPAFFFVKGLALGFGYNRRLVSPEIDQVKTFPLVVQALGAAERAGNSSSLSGAASSTVNDVVRSLGKWIPPSPGDYFLAVGIKFTSFELVDSFALLIVSFGNHFEVDLLGISTAIIPTPEAGNAVPAIAEVQMAIKVTFAPAEGLLSVQAQLTSASFLFSRDCHLTGGFAFVTWFNDASGHNGDFVLTLGGYHPHYQVPAHYPRVPALGFNWQLSSQFSIKGDAYFALTPNAVMAGGHLEATWKDGSLQASFRVGADFLIAWKPYHYEAAMYISLSIEYTYHFFGTHHISIDAGADLSIWGPDFSGKARVHISVVTFTVSFGGGASAPPPLTWTQFDDSFLPKPEQVVSLAPQAGLVKTAPADDVAKTPEVWIINPTDFSVTTNSVAPVTRVAFGAAAPIDLQSLKYLPDDAGRRVTPFAYDDATKAFAQANVSGQQTLAVTPIGIGSMGIKSTDGDFRSTCSIEIARDGTHFETHFAFAPIMKNVPAALWGDEARPSANGKKLIDDTVSGFRIIPKSPPAEGSSSAIDRRNLAFSMDDVDDGYAFEPDKTFEATGEPGRDRIQQTLRDSAVATRRRALIAAFGIQNPDAQLDIGDGVAAALLLDPQVTKRIA